MTPSNQRPELLSFHHLQPLRPFQPTPASAGLQLQFSVQRFVGGRIEFAFSLMADHAKSLDAIDIPELKPPLERQRRDELWKHTCLEIFVGPAEGRSYLEMNLSPSGDWNAYAFDAYRAGMRPATDAQGALSTVTRSNEGSSILWKGSLAKAGESGGEMDHVLSAPSLVMGATAVLEYRSGEREYWALAHTGPQPDFHLREGFRLKL